MSFSLLELLAVLAVAVSFAVWQAQIVLPIHEPEVLQRCQYSIAAAQRYHSERYWFQEEGARGCG